MHRNMPAGPDAFSRGLALSGGSGLCVDASSPGIGLLTVRSGGVPFVLGHALSMKAIHGGKAKNDKIDAQKIAVLLRGGMLPQPTLSRGDATTPRPASARMHLVRKTG